MSSYITFIKEKKEEQLSQPPEVDKNLNNLFAEKNAFLLDLNQDLGDSNGQSDKTIVIEGEENAVSSNELEQNLYNSDQDEHFLLSKSDSKTKQEDYIENHCIKENNNSNPPPKANQTIILENTYLEAKNMNNHQGNNIILSNKKENNLEDNNLAELKSQEFETCFNVKDTKDLKYEIKNNDLNQKSKKKESLLENFQKEQDNTENKTKENIKTLRNPETLLQTIKDPEDENLTSLERNSKKRKILISENILKIFSKLNQKN